jgi:hypothetical protein
MAQVGDFIAVFCGDTTPLASEGQPALSQPPPPYWVTKVLNRMDTDHPAFETADKRNFSQDEACLNVVYMERDLMDPMVFAMPADGLHTKDVVAAEGVRGIVSMKKELAAVEQCRDDITDAVKPSNNADDIKPALYPGTRVCCLVRRFGIGWAKRKYPTKWQTVLVSGTLIKMLGRETWSVSMIQMNNLSHQTLHILCLLPSLALTAEVILWTYTGSMLRATKLSCKWLSGLLPSLVCSYAAAGVHFS